MVTLSMIKMKIPSYCQKEKEMAERTRGDGIISLPQFETI